MKHPDVGTARFPLSAVQHWSGYGWVEVDPPEKPPRPPRPAGKPVRQRAPRPHTPPAEPVKSTPVDAKPDSDKKPPSTSTKKAPHGRKED